MSVAKVTGILNLLLSYNCTTVRRNPKLLHIFNTWHFHFCFPSLLFQKGSKGFPLSECHPLRVSRWTHCTFSPNLFHSQIICLYVCSRDILFQIKSCSLYEKSMSSPMVFELRNYALHTVQSPSTES